MKTLSDLLSGLDIVSCTDEQGLLNHEVKAVASDSRQVKAGYVFVALEGDTLDGHQYVQDAIAKGCLAVVIEKNVYISGNLAVIHVRDSHQAYGQMAAELYGHPGREMNLIALTGTNGKTTTSWIIENMLRENGRKTGVIGTVNYRFFGRDDRLVVREAPLTTPEPVLLQQLLCEMADAGVTDVVMEASSHALSQKRLAGLLFDVGVFTNLSRDHLDYHRTMEEYFEAKSRLFLEYLKDDGVAVVVVDSGAEAKGKSHLDWGGKLERILQEKTFQLYNGKRRNRSYLTCGFDKKCMVSAREFSQDIYGIKGRIFVNEQSFLLQSHLVGRYNALNILAATGTGLVLGLDGPAVQKGILKAGVIPGRLERVLLPADKEKVSGPHVFVDYAHTPDALENVLQTLQQVASGRLVCVFGCGGDRDKGKRPLMGEVAGRLANKIIVTSDNPRTENPLKILQEVEQGLENSRANKTRAHRLFEKETKVPEYIVMEDRSKAIHLACSMAGSDDVVLIAGKGHETYQLTRQGKRFFDDRVEAKNGMLGWTVEKLLSATRGKLEQHGKSRLLGEIVTDSRTITSGDIFLALKGENFDGHDFLDVAVQKGAAAVVVSELCRVDDQDVSVIKVDDTLNALGDLASYRRQLLAPELRVVGITGSSGKTTVKEMTAAIFEAQAAHLNYPAVLKTKGNFNNLIGLPLSLMDVRAEHATAVLEMGMNSPGEIRRLTEIADPDIGCITNIQHAHLEGLGSIEGVAKAKGELFQTMSDRGIRVVNYDDAHVRTLGGRHGNSVIGFAVTPKGRRHSPEVRATRVFNQGEAGMRFTLHINEWSQRITVPATGEHNVANSVAAAAIATAAGVIPEVIVQGLAGYKSGDKRLQIIQLPGGINVLNDSYNANPSSMVAALRTVAGFGDDCRRFAVLGDMFELGDASVACHREVGRVAAETGIDCLAVIGEYSEEVALAACKAGLDKDMAIRFDAIDDVVDWLMQLIAGKKIRQGDWLLIKGSRGMRMEKVLDSLTERLK